MKVWVVEQVEDHACGWVWGVFSTKELAEKWCSDNGRDSVEISEHDVDDAGELEEVPRG
jgi:hypothetical protein